MLTVIPIALAIHEQERMTRIEVAVVQGILKGLTEQQAHAIAWSVNQILKGVVERLLVTPKVVTFGTGLAGLTGTHPRPTTLSGIAVPAPGLAPPETLWNEIRPGFGLLKGSVVKLTCQSPCLFLFFIFNCS